MNGISNYNSIRFQGASEIKEMKNTSPAEEPSAMSDGLENDTVQLFSNAKYDGPKIGFWRAAFKRLTNEQIEAVNKTGKVPDNVKIMQNYDVTGYTLGNNIFNVTPGTTTVPAGFEFAKDFLGFTVIVPKDTKSVLIKE